MKCPGRDCSGSMAAGEIACGACLDLIHPTIRRRLEYLKRDAPDSAAHVTLVASIVRLLREGVP